MSDVGEFDDAVLTEREERNALRRVAGLSTELTDISEVEYRQLRLEQVVLVGCGRPARQSRPSGQWQSSHAWPRRLVRRC